MMMRSLYAQRRSVGKQRQKLTRPPPKFQHPPVQMPRPSMTAAFAASASDDKREFTVEIRETRVRTYKMDKSDLKAFFEDEFLDNDEVSAADKHKIQLELDAVMWQLAERKNPIIYLTTLNTGEEPNTEVFDGWFEEIKEKIESSYKSLKRLLDRVRGQ